MFTCMPRSLCSWEFQVSGLSTGPAILDFDFFTEYGRISIGGTEHAIRKHGILSGHWTLELDETTLAEAKKPNALSRTFDIRSGPTQLTVRAHTALTRRFDLFQGGETVGMIRPEHPFTRRAVIECDSSVPEAVQLFAFWLVVLTWRRSARNS
jgi:hypothetical protein